MRIILSTFERFIKMKHSLNLNYVLEKTLDLTLKPTNLILRSDKRVSSIITFLRKNTLKRIHFD